MPCASARGTAGRGGVLRTPGGHGGLAPEGGDHRPGGGQRRCWAEAESGTWKPIYFAVFQREESKSGALILLAADYFRHRTGRARPIPVKEARGVRVYGHRSRPGGARCSGVRRPVASRRRAVLGCTATGRVQEARGARVYGHGSRHGPPRSVSRSAGRHPGSQLPAKASQPSTGPRARTSPDCGDLVASVRRSPELRAEFATLHALAVVAAWFLRSGRRAAAVHRWCFRSFRRRLTRSRFG